jgi:hypothetical protein
MALPALASGAIATAIGYVLSRFVTKLLFALGVGVVSYAGADQIIDRVEAYLATLLGGIDSIYVQAWTVFGMPTALAMIFSAVGVRIALAGASKLVAGRKPAA